MQLNRMMMLLKAGNATMTMPDHGAAAAVNTEHNASAAQRPLLSDNEMWEAFGGRPISRISYGGAQIGEIRAAIEATGNGGTDEWHSAWKNMADRLVGVGDDCVANGHTLSARETYLRAAAYYQATYFPLFGKPVDARLIAAFENEVTAFQKALTLYDTPIEVLEIPFEGTTLPAYFAKVDDSGKPRPTLICTNGYDSNIQEMFFAHAPAALQRGYNCLLFDGPGQGRVLYKQGIPMRPNWESVVTPVIDYAVSRPEIDTRRMALVGWSFGGFLAPRAAAFEHRIAALIADPGQGDQRDAVLSMLPLTQKQKADFPNIDPHLLDGAAKKIESNPMMRWKVVQRSQWVHGTDSVFETLKALSEYSVLSVAHQITCPTLLTAAEGDFTAAMSKRLLAALTVTRKELVNFTNAEGAGGHCQAFSRALYHQRSFDWLDETFAMIA